MFVLLGRLWRLLVNADPNRRYRIEVRYNRMVPRWYRVYEGPWNRDAAFKFHNNTAAEVRVVPVLTEAECSPAGLRAIPQLRMLDDYLDRWYPMAGSADDEPNRTSANVQRRN